MTKHVGETYRNNLNDVATIIRYVNYNEVYVVFDGHEEEVKFRYNNLKNGEFKNPFTPSVCGVGYIGVGKYKTRIDGKKTKCYETWRDMLRRCYGDRPNYSTYCGCKVDESWHNFQTFAQWYDNNYYEFHGDKMCLDKDILVKGNKLYSANTCCFVPNRINTLLINCKRARGDLPLGIHRQDEYYVVQCSDNGIQEYVGIYHTKDDAFKAYKTHKEHIIKSVANDYKDIIPQKVYDALMSWCIEIND